MRPDVSDSVRSSRAIASTYRRRDLLDRPALEPRPFGRRRHLLVVESILCTEYYRQQQTSPFFRCSDEKKTRTAEAPKDPGRLVTLLIQRRRPERLRAGFAGAAR